MVYFHEVDFVAYGERGLLAFEIKRAQNPSNQHFKALNAFKKDYPPAKLYLVYTGNHREHHGDIDVIPFGDMLKNIDKIL